MLLTLGTRSLTHLTRRRLTQAHKAKNIGSLQKLKKEKPQKDEDEKNKPRESAAVGTKASSTVINLQRRLPMARVVYVSATGASEPAHLSYAVRLGLYGPGTSFPDFPDFVKAISKGGVGAMEVLCMQVKHGPSVVEMPCILTRRNVRR